MQEDVVPQDVPLDRLDERLPAALQSLEEIGAAESHEPLARTGQVVRSPSPRRASAARGASSRRNCPGRSAAGSRRLIVSTTSAAYSRAYWSFGSSSSILNFTVFGIAVGKYDRVPSANVRNFRPLARVGLGVVVLDEAARAADQVQPHQIPPVVGILALLEGGQRPDGALVPPDELGFAHLAQQCLGPDADVLVLGHEQPKLVRQVEIGLVVRRGGQQDALAVVLWMYSWMAR